jgi:hypothetical protein
MCLLRARNERLPAPGHAGGHGNRHELGGLTDSAFSLIPNIEAGLAARWAWEEPAAADR